jgi:aminoglycoside phosphotransferase
MDEVFINWAINELGGADITEREQHGDQSTVYRIRTIRDSYFLKIAPDLTAEHERLQWLENKLPAPKVISFIRIEDRDVLLLSAIEGKDLAVLKNEWPAEKVVEKFAEALLRFHGTKTRDCSFGNPGRNKVLVHGDACLPNLIFNGEMFSGYIDLGNMRIDTPDVDLAAAVWSLDHNLGPGYGLSFLKKYGVKKPDEELEKRLKSQYGAIRNE